MAVILISMQLIPICMFFLDNLFAESQNKTHEVGMWHAPLTSGEDDKSAFNNYPITISKIKQMENITADGSLGAYPYAVSIQRGYKTGYHYCNGAIIGTNTVITSAVCCYTKYFTYYKTYVVAGTVSLDDELNSLYFEVEHCIKHEGPYHQIAVMKLADKIEFNDRILPITIATGQTPDSDDYILTTWGTTNPMESDGWHDETLRVLQVNLRKTTSCDIRASEINFRKQFCIESDSDVKVCYGDQGAPLVYDNVLYGVMFFHWIGCGDFIYANRKNMDPPTRNYYYFSEVNTYLPWLVKIKNNQDVYEYNLIKPKHIFLSDVAVNLQNHKLFCMYLTPLIVLLIN